MNKKNKHISPGYNETVTGIIPVDWATQKLETVAEILQGISKGKKYKIGESIHYPYLRVANVKDGYFDLAEIKTIEVSKIQYKKYLIERNDILITEGGDSDKLGRGCIWKNDLETCVFQNHLFRIRTNQTILDPEFLFNYIQSKRAKTYFLNCSKQTTGIASINTSQVNCFPIPLPPLPEQKAIARVLSTWDEAIQQTEQLISQKELRKKWLMQTLLTGKMKLNGFENTKWKVQPLENFIKPVIREVAKPIEPYLGIGLRSHGKGTFLKPNEQPEKNSMNKFYVVRPNDLIVNITFAWEQAIAIVRPEDDGALASHRFPTYTFMEEKGNPDFFRFFILQPRLKFMLEMISPGGAGRNRVMSKSDFINLEFLLPEHKEQAAIAQVLQTADREIQLLKEQVRKLREQKKGLMQVLLTGKKRLNV